MAKEWDSYDDYYDDAPLRYNQGGRWQQNIDSVLWGNRSEVDPVAQELFASAFFQKNEGAYNELVDYMQIQYGIDFEDAFEWTDFRQWYEGTVQAA